MSEEVPSAPPAPRAPATEVRSRVFAEADRFRQALPSLLPLHREKWVVFRDGEVASAHATHEEAYVAGLERFGLDGGHVVALVREVEVVFLSGVAALGF